MMEEQASSVIELAKRPEGVPDESTFRFGVIAISEIGEALLKSLYVSVDPGMRGFMVFDFKDQFEQAKDQLSRWYNSGKLRHRQTVAEGFKRIPSTFMGLVYAGYISQQLGKLSARSFVQASATNELANVPWMVYAR